MTVAFMALFAMVLSDRMSAHGARVLLWPLVLAGVASVGYWYWSERHGRGDLRAYGVIQFLPMLLIPLMLLFCKQRQLVPPGCGGHWGPTPWPKWRSTLTHAFSTRRDREWPQPQARLRGACGALGDLCGAPVAPMTPHTRAGRRRHTATPDAEATWTSAGKLSHVGVSRTPRAAAPTMRPDTLRSWRATCGTMSAGGRHPLRQDAPLWCPQRSCARGGGPHDHWTSAACGLPYGFPSPVKDNTHDSRRDSPSHRETDGGKSGS